MRRYRRKELLCPTCGEHKVYRSDRVICDECIRLIAVGRQFEAAKEAKESPDVVLALGDHFLYEHNLSDEAHKQAESGHSVTFRNSLVRLIFQVAGKEPELAFDSPTKLDETLYTSHTTGDLMAIVSQEQAKAIHELVDFIGLLKYAAYCEGHRKGLGLLTGLADGSLSIEQFNKATINK